MGADRATTVHHPNHAASKHHIITEPYIVQTASVNIVPAAATAQKIYAAVTTYVRVAIMV